MFRQVGYHLKEELMFRQVSYYGQRWRRCSGRYHLKEELEMFREVG